MEKLISIKENLKNINSLISKLENGNLSTIEKDIILQNLRDLYLLVNSVESLDHEVIQAKESIVETKLKEPVQPKDEQVVVKEEPKIEEKEVELMDFVDDQVEEIKEESVIEKTHSEPINESPKQQNLFANSNGGNNVKTVGETLGQNKRSLNERLADNSKNDVASKISQKPVTDIKAAIGIGDRFLYIRELFNGNNDTFEQTVTHLNSLNSFDDAESYIRSNFDWDDSDETVLNFVSVVKRKYIKL